MAMALAGLAGSPAVGAEEALQQFELGTIALESGARLPNARLAYVTHGALNADKSNAVLLPSFYAGDHHGYDFLIGPGKALDPSKYFIIVVNQFGGGQSSSPSNTPPPNDRSAFPAIAVRDNVDAAHRLIGEKFGIARLKAIVGFSMGAQSAYQWAVSHPSAMEKVVAYCGSAKEYPHGIVRLEGLKSAIAADAAFADGRYDAPPAKGLKAAGRHWAAWGFSQEWYRAELFRKFGHQSVEEHLTKFWEAFFLSQDANNLVTQALTWQSNNVGDTPGFGGDHEKALRSIKARVLVMPCQTDLYFPPQYAEREVPMIPNARLVPIPSVWGHIAGLGVNAEDAAFLNRMIRDFLR
jgi:homoserine O-acetyltransferase/O-succinyltransferase